MSLESRTERTLVLRRAGSVAFGAMMALLCGCGVVFTTGKPGTGTGTKYVYTEKELTALTYYLPKDVLEVVAQIDTQTSASIVYQLKKDGAGNPVLDADGNEIPDKDKPPELKKATPVTKLANLDLSIVTIADRSKPFLIDANSAGFYKNDSAINVSEAGLLESVNTKTAGAAGTVVQNVLKLAGTVLPFLSGVPTVPTGPTRDAVYETKQQGALQIQSALKTRDQPQRVVRGKEPDSCDDARMRTETPNDPEAKAFSEQYFGDRPELRFALPKLPDYWRLKRDFCETFKNLIARKTQLDDATNDLARESNKDRIKPATIKVQAMRSEANRATDAHKAARDAINTAVAEVLADLGVGTVKKSATRKFLLDQKEIPDTAEVLKLPSNAVPRDKIDQLVNGKDRAKELFEKTGAVISYAAVQPLSAPATDVDGTAYAWAGNKHETCTKGLTKSEACVHYREPILFSLSVWTSRKLSDEEAAAVAGGVVPVPEYFQLQPPEERLLLLVGANSPTRAIDLPVNAWSKRDTAITFNARGRIVTLQRNSESSAADATGAIQEGLRSGLTEYQTSLTSIKTIGETKQAIALQPLQQQITAAQKQLELIKAQTSLGAASSSSQALLDTELATIEKNLITAQQQLVAAQNQLLKDTATGENFAEVNAVAEANAALATQIQQLKNEIDLIKLKKELAELQSGSSP